MLPAVGAAASFGLLAFMSSQALLFGGAVLALATIWYWGYVRRQRQGRG